MIKILLSLSIILTGIFGCSKSRSTANDDAQSAKVVIEFVMNRVLSQTAVAQRLREIIRMSDSEAKVQLLKLESQRNLIIAMSRMIIIRQRDLLRESGVISADIPIEDFEHMTTDESAEYLKELSIEIEKRLVDYSSKKSSQ